MRDFIDVHPAPDREIRLGKAPHSRNQGGDMGGEGGVRSILCHAECGDQKGTKPGTPFRHTPICISIMQPVLSNDI